MFSFCLGAAYKKCPEFILINEGPLLYYNSVFAGTSNKSDMSPASMGSTKYVKWEAQNPEKKRTEKKRVKKERDAVMQERNGTKM